MVALAFAMLQVPPLAAFESVMLVPATTFDAPVIVPALGSGFTVTAYAATAVPHELVIE
jgi:hypothetical protein